MKKFFLMLVYIAILTVTNSYAQCGGSTSTKFARTSIGIVIYSNDVETIWNALRFANYAKQEGDTVSIFLLGKGVELDSLVNKNADIKEQTELFLENGAAIMGCGTCLSTRKNNAPQYCKYSSMRDLYDLVRKSKIVMTF